MRATLLTMKYFLWVFGTQLHVALIQLYIYYCRYHHFRLKPVPGVEVPLRLKREMGNPFSTTAVTVQLPQLCELTPTACNKMVEYRGVSQPLGHFAGGIVGRVSSELTTVVYNLLGEDLVSARGFFTGNIIHGGPVRGGGPQLEYCLVFFLQGDYLTQLKTVTDQFRGHVPDDCLFA